jgi:hypothetical protein
MSMLLERLHWLNSPLGDSCNSTGMASSKTWSSKFIQASSYILYTSTRIRMTTEKQDLCVACSHLAPIELTSRTQYGNVNEQVAFVADQLASIPELKNGFDAIGFSQGIFLHQDWFESS